MHIWVVYVTSNTFSSGVFSTNANYRLSPVEHFQNYLPSTRWFLEFTRISWALLIYLQFIANSLKIYTIIFAPNLLHPHTYQLRGKFFNHPGGQVGVIHTFATIGIVELSHLGQQFLWKPPKIMWCQLFFQIQYFHTFTIFLHQGTFTPDSHKPDLSSFPCDIMKQRQARRMEPLVKTSYKSLIPLEEWLIYMETREACFA